MKIFIITLFNIFLLISNSFTQNYGGWTIADSLNEPRQYHSSVILSNGDLLVTGSTGSNFRSSCEIYDIQTFKWRYTDSMQIGRADHHSILLNNNKVIVIGGYKIKSCEIFDSQTETWTFTDSLNVRRMFGHTSTMLYNGKVLVVGGYNVPDDSIHGVKLINCEIYNPDTEEWIITDSLHYERWYHTTTLLSDGKVFVCGGYILPAEIYDPVTQEWTIVDSMTIKRAWHSATLLDDGRVLIAGGYTIDDSLNSWTNECEVYDPILDEWSTVGPLQYARNMHNGILLNNGLILFAGGEFASTVWELYDPSIMQMVYWDYYPVDKFLPTMHLLPDGRVISIGGISWKGISLFPTEICEIYDPSLNDIRHLNNSVPNKFELYQNYPNPFNPSTIIKYYLPIKSYMKLKVYDVSGRLVSTLVDEFQSAGIHSFNFNAQNLSSGIYLVSLQTEKFVSTIKILKLK